MNVTQNFPASPAAIEKITPGMPRPPVFETVKEERQYRKQRLAASCRLFSKFGFDEGALGHITVRDPEFTELVLGKSFRNAFQHNQSVRSYSCKSRWKGRRRQSSGQCSRLRHSLTRARGAPGRDQRRACAFNIWTRVCGFGTKLDPISQDACAFYNDHELYADYGGVAVELDEGQQIADVLGSHKAAILQNHGLLTVGQTVDEAAWWFITMERSCEVQLLAEAAAARTNQPLRFISDEVARQTFQIVGSPLSGWFQFQSLYGWILKEQPDFLD